MSYDRCCRLYGQDAAVTGASSRVGHKVARSIEVDWSGPTLQMLGPSTSEILKVYLFVACLPAIQPVYVRGSEPGYAPGFMAARSNGDVRLLRRQCCTPGAR